MVERALIVDWEGLLENFDNDIYAISMVIEMFLGTAADSLDRVRLAVQAGDAKEIAMSAHSFKGAISNFGAKDAVRIAQALEGHGYGAVRRDVKALFHQLEENVSAIIFELNQEGHRYRT